MSYSEMTPAGQDLSQRDVFFMIYKEGLAEGKPIAEAREEALVKSRQFQETKTEARNDGLDAAQATVIANKVAQEGKDYSTAVEETTGKSSIETKIQAGAIKVEQWIIENWLVVAIGVIVALASVVFLFFTKSGKQVAKAITGAPVKR